MRRKSIAILTSLLVVMVAILAFAPILNATPLKGAVNGCTSAFCLDTLPLISLQVV